MKLINLTMHDINIYDEDDNEVLVVKTTKTEARIKTNSLRIGNFLVDGIHVPLYQTKVSGQPYCNLSDDTESEFPPQKSNTAYIVSAVFRQHYDRDDLWQPEQLLRDEKGQPYGCVGLSR